MLNLFQSRLKALCTVKGKPSGLPEPARRDCGQGRNLGSVSIQSMHARKYALWGRWGHRTVQSVLQFIKQRSVFESRHSNVTLFLADFQFASLAASSYPTILRLLFLELYWHDTDIYWQRDNQMEGFEFLRDISIFTETSNTIHDKPKPESSD